MLTLSDISKKFNAAKSLWFKGVGSGILHAMVARPHIGVSGTQRSCKKYVLRDGNWSC